MATNAQSAVPESTGHAVHHHADDEQKLGSALSDLRSHTCKETTEAHDGILAPAHAADHVAHPHSLSEYVSLGWARIVDAAALYRWGNYVIDRHTGEKTFEQMPLYVRMGMHLLYVGGFETAFLENACFAQKLFIKESVSMGTFFDSPESKKKIPGFVQAFNLKLDELAEPDPNKYANFNKFFSRALKPDARPTAGANDPRQLCCAADCRLVVFDSVDEATRLWIKGTQFSVASLLGAGKEALAAHYFGGRIAIFRLAPADYHRWHSPVDGTIKSIDPVKGLLMTVNPMAINEDLNVFTENKRDVCLIDTAHAKTPVAVVAIGAMLVGSISWLCKVGDGQEKNQPQGYFEYGGSTVICLFPASMDVEFDADLLENSRRQIETIVKAGESLGKIMSSDL